MSFPQLSTAACPSTTQTYTAGLSLSRSLPRVHSKGQVTREKKWRRSKAQQLSVWRAADEWQRVCHRIMRAALSTPRHCLRAPRWAQTLWRFTLTPIRQHKGTSSARCGRPEMPLSVGIPLGTPERLFRSFVASKWDAELTMCGYMCPLLTRG